MNAPDDPTEPRPPAELPPSSLSSLSPQQRGPDQRVQIQRRRRAPSTSLTLTKEIDEQTRLGSALLRSLMRAQLRLAAGILGFLALTLGGLPLLFYAKPQLNHATIAGIHLPWILLGAVVYPLLVALGWFFVRRAERNERAFSDMVEQKQR